AQAIEIALTAKEFDQAENLISKATELHPKDQRFYSYGVLVSDFQKKTEEGNNRLAVALKALPDSESLLRMQFERQVQARDLAGAKVTLKQLSATKIAPAFRGLLEAKLLFAEGQHQAATQKLETLRPQVAKVPQLAQQADQLLMDCYH